MTAAVRLAATPGTLRKSWRYLLLAGTHAAVAALGFAAGIYTLPILTAPAAPPMADVQAQQARATWRGEFRRDLRGSDLLHWGEGAVTLGPQGIAFAGRLAPGPDYKLYLSPDFVETRPTSSGSSRAWCAWATCAPSMASCCRCRPRWTRRSSTP